MLPAIIAHCVDPRYASMNPPSGSTPVSNGGHGDPLATCPPATSVQACMAWSGWGECHDCSYGRIYQTNLVSINCIRSLLDGVWSIPVHECLYVYSSETTGPPHACCETLFRRLYLYLRTVCLVTCLRSCVVVVVVVVVCVSVC